MGEIADDHYDQMMDGGLDHDEDSYGRHFGQHLYRDRPIVCKHCRSTRVRWFRDSTGWRLYNTADSELHNCLTGAAPSAEGFGDVG